MLNKEPDRYMVLLQASENILGKVVVHDGVLQSHDERIALIESRMPVNSRNALNIRRRVVTRAAKILGSNKHPEYRKTISRLWHDYWQVFGVTSYHDTPAALYDEAIAYIDAWKPISIVSDNQSA